MEDIEAVMRIEAEARRIGRAEERREFLAWLRAMGQMFPAEAAGAAFLADEYEKAVARQDNVGAS